MMNTLIKNVINNKRIVLWGTGNTAQEFYKKYCDKLPVYACTSNDREIVPIESLNTIKPCEIEPQSDFIIICSVYYDEIRYQLMCMGGYEPNINFMKYDVFEKLYSAEINSKKVLIAVGQCEINEMCQTLNLLHHFKEKYAVFYFDEQRV